MCTWCHAHVVLCNHMTESTFGYFTAFVLDCLGQSVGQSFYLKLPPLRRLHAYVWSAVYQIPLVYVVLLQKKTWKTRGRGCCSTKKKMILSTPLHSHPISQLAVRLNMAPWVQFSRHRQLDLRNPSATGCHSSFCLCLTLDWLSSSPSFAQW